MIIEKHHLNQPLPHDIKIERFDTAINFYATINLDNEPHLICYDYNPVWDSWYPFYDDINKTPVIHHSSAKTYKGLIEECDHLINIDLKEKLSLAKQRFDDLIGDTNLTLEKLDNFTVYEIKYSKTANLYTIYKLYNFVVTNAENIDTLIHPKQLKCKLFNLNSTKHEKLVSNAEYIATHEDLTKYCLSSASKHS